MSDDHDTTSPSTTTHSSPAVLQIRIDLDDTKPPTWRRLNLQAGLTLDVVHQIIQDAFGWEDSHLHRFTLGRPATFFLLILSPRRDPMLSLMLTPLTLCVASVAAPPFIEPARHADNQRSSVPAELFG